MSKTFFKSYSGAGGPLPSVKIVFKKSVGFTLPPTGLGLPDLAQPHHLLFNPCEKKEQSNEGRQVPSSPGRRERRVFPFFVAFVSFCASGTRPGFATGWQRLDL